MMKRMGLGMLFVGFLGACGTSSDTVEQLVDSYATTLDTMETTASAHASKIQASSVLDDIRNEERTFFDTMGQLMEDMMGTSDRLEQCEGMSMMDMDSMNQQMQQELEDHYAAMMDAQTPEEAMDEEARYQGMMEGMFGQMQQWDEDMMGMMDMGGACPDDMMMGNDMGGGSGSME